MARAVEVGGKEVQAFQDMGSSGEGMGEGIIWDAVRQPVTPRPPMLFVRAVVLELAFRRASSSRTILTMPKTFPLAISSENVPLSSARVCLPPLHILFLRIPTRCVQSTPGYCRLRASIVGVRVAWRAQSTTSDFADQNAQPDRMFSGTQLWRLT